MSVARFVELPDESLTPLQVEAVRQVTSSRGAIGGPFIALLRSPELMKRLGAVGDYLRFQSDLPRSIFEMAVLMTARAYDQSFEWDHHVPLAITAGLSETTIGELALGAFPSDLDAPHQTGADLVCELLTTHQIRDDTFTRAASILGESQVVDLVGAVGYYVTLALVLNTARTNAPGLIDSRLPTIDSGW